MIWALAVSACLSGVMLGFVPAIVSLNLHDMGVSSTLVGMNSAMPYVALLLVGPFLPHVVRRVGVLGSILWGGVGTSISLVLFPLMSGSVVAWFVLRFVFGVFYAFPWMVAEIWISRISSNAVRGRAVALYMSLWGIGLACGPQVITLVGYKGWTPFLMAAGLVFAALVPPCLVRHLQPEFKEERGRGFMLTLLHMAPLPFLVALVAGIGEVVVLALFPLYATRFVTTLTMSSALTVFGVGGFLLQPLGGWMSDRMGRVRLLAVYVLMAIGGAAVLPFVLEGGLLWPVIFLWGGAIIGLYGAGLMLLGDVFGQGDTAGGNAVYGMAFTIGSIGGPILAGWFMNVSPLFGFPFAIGLPFSLVLLACVLWRRHGMA
ncbi:MAG: hypothetical protein A2018_04855 [Alphaproteobacteria bacterium GWF2_58_20]|nr:MAG: hypothetical protein A2018_04855 [Alphaproteobacteria bacterium GWF2_58_20]